MRIHVHLDDEVVKALDERVGPRGRSAFIEDAVKRSLNEETRWDLIFAAAGSISDEGHIWDPDPAKWVHDSRRSDPRVVG